MSPVSKVTELPIQRSRTSSVHRSRPSSPKASRSAGTLLDHARTGLAQADWELDPGEKFSQAYLAALRAGAAMLALRGRPHRGRARPTSVWVLLTKVAPELSEWAEFFAAGSSTCAAVQAGISRTVSQRSADDLARQAAQFLAIVERAMREDRRERIFR